MSLFNQSSSKDSGQQPDTKHCDSQPDWWDAAFLVDEAKFRHQQHSMKRSSRDDQVTLGYILKEILNIDPADIGAMTIVSREAFASECKTETIEDPSDVLAYKPFDAILDCTPEGECKIRGGQNTVLVISFRPSHLICLKSDERKDKSNQHTDNSIIMYLRALDPFSKGSEYMRVSVLIPNFIGSDDFRNPQSPNTPFTASFILVYDTVPPEKRLEEYERVKQSLDKGLEADRSLTQEELAVLEGITGTQGLARELNYARWLISRNCYVDALPSLMKAYELVSAKLPKNSEELKDAYSEICLNIGLCYNRLEQFDRAAYYLGMVLDRSDDVHYAVELINAQAYSCGPRAMWTVARYIKECEEGKWDDVPEFGAFCQFLYRQMACLYIKHEIWDNARVLLEQMKDVPGDREFALGQLEYLRSLGKA